MIDVEDFDWALPGYMDSTQLYDGGGILIWHIDENIISQNIATNTVNANNKLRGVDLEEADGSQDIGQSYGQFTPASGSEYGNPLDFWFMENNSPIYKNRFDESSYPNSNSNSGAKSFVSIRNFSSRSPRMTADVEFGALGIRPVELLKKDFNNGNGTIITIDSVIVIYFPDKIYMFHTNGNSLISASNGNLAAVSINDVAFTRLSQESIFIAATGFRTLYSWLLSDENHDVVYETIVTTATTLTHEISSSPAIFRESGKIIIAVGDKEGYLRFFDSTLTTVDSMRFFSEPLLSFTIKSKNEVYAVSKNSVASLAKSLQISLIDPKPVLYYITDRKGDFIVLVDRIKKEVLTFSVDLSRVHSQQTLQVENIAGVAVADINADGTNDIIINGSNFLYAINKFGNIIERFPISARNTYSFNGNPLIIDLDSDTSPDLLVTISTGSLYAFSNNVEIKNAFPFQISNNPIHSYAIAQLNGNKVLLSIDERGLLTAYEIQSAFVSSYNMWTQAWSDPQRSGIVLPSPYEVYRANELMPKQRAYNWPNPVTTQTTNIRYYLEEQADVTIKIYNLAGELVTTLYDKGEGGTDNEVVWNVKDIQTGIYIAHIEAKSSATTATTTIKIAVVK